MKLDNHAIKEMMKILQEQGLEELTYEGEQGKIKLKSSGLAPGLSYATEEKENDQIEKVKNEQRAKEIEDAYIISEQIGKYYFIQENGNSYLEVGKSIKVGEIIGYVTSIGISTPFVSKKSGVIEEILVKNGDIIDYGKKLIKVRA